MKIKVISVVALCLSLILFSDVWVHGKMAAGLAADAHMQAPQPLQHLFWDMAPYETGIQAFNQGQSPYTLNDPENELPFAYPPVFVWVGAAMARVLPPNWGHRIYIGVYMLSVYGLELLLGWFFLRPLNKFETAGLLCFAPLGAYLSTVFLSGNVHIIWYSAALLAAIPGLAHKRWLPFYIISFLAIANQPVLALLLLLPVFTGRLAEILGSALTVAAGAGVYVAEWICSPQLYHDFRATITLHLQASHDYGSGVLGILAGSQGRYHESLLLAGVMQAIFSAAVLLALVWLRPRMRTNDRRWWALIALAIVLANPRIMPYDAALGLIPAICFFLFAVPAPWQWLAALMASIACAALHPHPELLPLLLPAFVLGVWQCSRGPSRQSSEPEASPLRSAARL